MFPTLNLFGSVVCFVFVYRGGVSSSSCSAVGGELLSHLLRRLCLDRTPPPHRPCLRPHLWQRLHRRCPEPPPPHRVGQCAGGSLRFRRLGRRSRHGHPYQWAGGEEFRLCPRLLFSGVRCPPVRCPAHPRLPRRVAEAEAALPHLQGEGLPAADAAHRPPPGGRRRLPAGQAGAGAGAAGVGERPPPPGLREQAAKGGMCAIQFCAVSPVFMVWGFCRVSL